MKTYTFEIKTLSGEWKPIFGTSGNTSDPETGCCVIACKTAKPYKSCGDDAAQADLAFFQRKAGIDRVRIAERRLNESQG